MNQVRDRFSPRVAVIAPEGESMTQQHFAEEVDINNIVAKYNRSGIITHVRAAQEKFGPLPELSEYAVHLDKVAKAQQAFEMLPAELRNHFNNSIPGFFKYISEEKNFDQCVEWGIYEPKEPKVGTPTAAAPDLNAQATKSGAQKKTKIIQPSESEEGA